MDLGGKKVGRNVRGNSHLYDCRYVYRTPARPSPTGFSPREWKMRTGVLFASCGGLNRRFMSMVLDCMAIDTLR